MYSQFMMHGHKNIRCHSCAMKCSTNTKLFFRWVAGTNEVPLQGWWRNGWHLRNKKLPKNIIDCRLRIITL